MSLIFFSIFFFNFFIAGLWKKLPYTWNKLPYTHNYFIDNLTVATVNALFIAGGSGAAQRVGS